MVHITEDGVKLLDPLEVTRTHVVVNVTGPSQFGLVWRRVCEYLHPKSARILLLLQPPEVRSRRLHVMLLPGNLPARVVTNTGGRFSSS